MQEVIAFLDYSFERAFTVQEKEYIMSYKVSQYEVSSIRSNTWLKLHKTSKS
jgi:hypothetical protein